MPKAKARVGERWRVRLRGRRCWRTIAVIRHDPKQGRLYGVRDAECPLYALMPASQSPKNNGRFLRARDLIFHDKRIRRHSTTSRLTAHNPRELAPSRRNRLHHSKTPTRSERP